MSLSEEQAVAGQAIYSRKTLSVYDLVVIAISNPYIWKCPSEKITAHYNANLSANHLDVGVGTGYFLDRCQFPSQQPRIALMDMNPNTLAVASRRIRRYQPTTYQQNVLKPISYPVEPFDSVGVNYLFHCMPGTLAQKMIALDHLKAVMQPGCRVFGSTILSDGVERSWSARKLMAFYNKKAVFSNTEDDLNSLKTELVSRYSDVSVDIQGSVALFSGRLD